MMPPIASARAVMPTPSPLSRTLRTVLQQLLPLLLGLGVGLA
jgi:hypothetical protein